MASLDIKLKNLHLKGYRGFLDSGEIQLHEKVNIFIGENGAGKTSLMEVLEKGLLLPQVLLTSGMVDDFTREVFNYRPGYLALSLDDTVHVSTDTVDIFLRFELKLEDTFTHDLSIRYGKTNNSLAKHQQIKAILKDEQFPFFKMMMEKINNSNVDSYPLLATGNGVEIASAATKLLQNLNNPLEGYKGFSDKKSFFLFYFKEWFTWQENLTRQIPERKGIFQKSCQAIYALLSDEEHLYSDLFTDWKQGVKGEVMIHKNGMPLPLSYLSSGELALLRMVTGIVWRLHTLNPGLENPLHGNGVLLIDEIDLHLHPRWQQKVVTKLTELFPNLQILLTTHSPFILQRFGPEDGRVFRIENFKIKPEKSVKYWTLQDVVEEVQHTESEATLRQKLLQKAFNLLDEEQLDALKSEFAALEQQLPPNDKDLLFLKNEINFLEDSGI